MPFAKLGYQRMDDFLKSIPDVVSSYTNYQDGMLYVKAVPLAGSSHINELVQGQRTSKKKKATSNYSMISRFKSFRVSSQVAPNRNFNRNYNTCKPPERSDNTRNGNSIRQPLYQNQSYNLPPRFMNLNHQAPVSTPLMQKPNFLPPSTYSPRVPTTTGPRMFSNNYNINNNKIFTNPKMEPKPVAVPLSLSITPANKPQGVPGRAHLTPQLMQPRTPAPQSDTPATPPDPYQTSNVLPTPQVIQKPSAFVDPVQKSLSNLKISSSKPVDPINPFKQDSKAPMQQLPKPLSPVKVHEEISPNLFLWKPVGPKPPQEVTKPAQQFYPSGFMQRPTVPRRVIVKSEEERPRSPVAETLTQRLAVMIKKEDPVPAPPKISPLARAPRVLLRNAMPIVNPPAPLQTPRRFVFLPDRLPPVAPSKPPSVSPLLSRRFPCQAVESESVSRTVVMKDFTCKSTAAVLSTR